MDRAQSYPAHVSWMKTGCICALLLLAVPARAGQACDDAVFLQTEARIAELASSAEQVRAWQNFLANNPDQPCAAEVRARIAALAASEQAEQEQQQREAWTQEARGGVVEPNRDEFPQHAIFPDAAPLDRIQLLSEVIWLGPDWKSDYGQENLALEVANDTLWTLVLKGEMAVVSHLGLQVELPVVFGRIEGEGFQTGLGNIGVGIRGLWGTRLSGDRYPWVISGGVLVGTGTSLWSHHDHRALLDAAAIGAAHLRHLYRFDSPDYVAHAESQIGLGSQFFGLALAYHVYAGGEHVERILRVDLAWDWRLSDLLTVGLELNGGFGDGEPVVGATENTFLAFLFVSPGLRLSWSWAMAQIAVRVPLIDAWDWTRLISSIELGARF